MAYAAEGAYRFDFGPGTAAPGFSRVAATTLYSGESAGFDFGSAVTCVERGGQDPLRSDFCTGEGPFFFSVRVPEGNYRLDPARGGGALLDVGCYGVGLALAALGSGPASVVPRQRLKPWLSVSVAVSQVTSTWVPGR